MNWKQASAFVAACVFIYSSSTAEAAEEETRDTNQALSLASITVTANKVEEDPQTIPFSISVLDEVSIEDRNISKTEDLFRIIPNMNLTKSGPAGATDIIASMRGITSFMTGGTVFGYFVDGVYTPSYDTNLVDVERIEVLRGPQGTLYGKNSEAGVINIITEEPKNDWGGDISVTYSSYNTFDTTVSAGGALVDNLLLLSLAGRFSSSDGYYTNTVDGDDQVDENDNYDGRIALRYMPTDRLTADLKINRQDYNSNYAEFSSFDSVLNGDFDVEVNDPGYSDKDQTDASLKIVYDMDSVTLTSITSLLNDDLVNGNDMDFTSYDFYHFDAEFEHEQYAEELRLSSDNSSDLKWTVGTYLYTGEDDQTILFKVAGYGVAEEYGNTDDSGAAIFGQADYSIGAFVLTGGLRYEYEQKDYDYLWKGGESLGYTPCSGSTNKNFDALLPKLALTYNLTDTFRPYASVSRGFKSGGFNLSSDPGVAYDSEYTWNYEVGFKSELLDNHVLFNFALFYIDWDDMQVEQPSYPDYVIENAAEATSKGAEVEITARPMEGLDVYGSVGLVDATFDKYVLDGVDCSDNNVPNAPESTYSLGATYRFLRNWMVNAEINGTGKVYYEASNDKSQDSYQIVNLKIGYESEKLDIYLFAENLFDEAYATRVFEMDGLDGNEAWWARNGDPLTVGMTMRYRF